MSFVFHTLLVTLRVMLPGLLWLPESDRRPRGWAVSELLAVCGRSVALGLVLNLLIVLFAAALQRWTEWVDWSVWGLVVGTGLVGFWRRKGRPRDVAALVPVGVVVAAVLLAPHRSEWLAGGWDPGVYQNNAISIAARSGTQPLRDTVFAGLSRQERELVSTPEGTYREVQPGVPINMADGSLPLYFFPLTSLCGAWLHRLGGNELLYRMPMLLAFLGLFPAISLLQVLGGSRTMRWASLLFWVASPLWWYHQAVPVSELLQLLLLCSAALFYVDSRWNGGHSPVLAFLFLFAGTVNRFEFPVFAGFFLLLATWTDCRDERPGWQRRVAVCYGALAAGLLWDLAFSWVTVSRLHAKDHVLWVVLLPFSISALAAGVLMWRRDLPVRVGRHGQRVLGVLRVGALSFAAVLLLLGMAVSTSAVAASFLGRLPILGGMAWRTSRLLAYQGTWCFVAAALGVLTLSRNRNPEGLATWRVTSALGIAVSVLLLHGGIAPLYPWALRRYVVYLVPFLALAQGYAASRVVASSKGRSKAVLLMGALLMTAALIEGATRSVSAARVGDYKGLATVLRQLDSHLQVGDVVVADDPRWGTPLLLAFGRDVIDGKRLWSGDSALQKGYTQMLRRLQREPGRRVLWLTSTDQGPGIYPFRLGEMHPLAAAVPFTYETVAHSARGTGYNTKENHRLFGLHAWGSDAHGGVRETPAPGIPP